MSYFECTALKTPALLLLLRLSFSRLRAVVGGLLESRCSSTAAFPCSSRVLGINCSYLMIKRTFSIDEIRLAFWLLLPMRDICSPNRIRLCRFRRRRPFLLELYDTVACVIADVETEHNPVYILREEKKPFSSLCLSFVLCHSLIRSFA